MRRHLLQHATCIWCRARRATSCPFGGAIALALLIGGLLIESSVVPTTAQPTGPGGPSDPAYFPATGYRISQPSLLAYFQRRGGVRTFGYPISGEFLLLGKRVQLFQRQALEVKPDSTVGALNLFEPDILPVTHFDGLQLPAPDPDLVTAAPSPLDPDYLTLALALVDEVVPDDWNGRDVNFHATFVDSVTCSEEVGPDEACDPALLAALGLEIWGLPTSRPMADPSNKDFIYQRFQRGVMHYSASTGLTQALLLGDWFKRVLMGSDVPADAQKDLEGSPFLGQYAPSRPLGVARPAVLTDTTLATAFTSDTLVAAQVATPTETIPPGVAGTATSVAMTATAVGGTSVSLQATQVAATATALAGTQTAAPSAPATPVAAAVPGAPAAPLVGPPTVAPVLLGTPTTFVGCLGDEQMWFTPRKPYIGTHVDISVTSQRHHDTHIMRLTGPIDSGAVVERSSIFGWTWTWTVVPTAEGFYNWTFYSDGLRPCITSGFPTLPQIGATATATVTPVASATATSTGTATSTPTPGVPSITSVAPASGTCGDLVSINGTNFGSPPSSAGTQIQLQGPEGTKALAVLGGSNTTLAATLPNAPAGLQPDPAGTPRHRILVISNSGVSNAFPFTVTTTC
jgi:hypothetical protein